jgi:hypothetical protein
LSAKELEELRKIVDSFKKKNDRLYNQINRISFFLLSLTLLEKKKCISSMVLSLVWFVFFIIDSVFYN